MTLANKITFARIGLIPIFLGALMYYQASVRDGAPDEIFRWIAVGAFLTAALSDALDGFIARCFNQHSYLGSILDPVADKGLVLSALISLSWMDVPGLFRIPIWFLVLVLTRDVVLIVGYCILHLTGERVKISAHGLGKTATFLMMTALSAILLKLPMDWCQAFVILSGVFTLLSIVVYLRRGVELFGQFQLLPPEDTRK
ncbi:MAG: CDP-alcohol phosphatidyltransferase family protein [Verrucomicrobiota bacterium]